MICGGELQMTALSEKKGSLDLILSVLKFQQIRNEEMFQLWMTL